MAARARAIDWRDETGIRVIPAPAAERLRAAMIDALVILTLAVAVALLAFLASIGPFFASVPAADGPSLPPVPVWIVGQAGLIGAAGGLAYLPWCWSRTGRTIGKMVVGHRVVQAGDDGPVSAGRAIVRLAGLVVAVLPAGLGIARIATDQDGRGWHDLIAGTRVIAVRSR
jgi:uncharacterized RDD family membrane protein YckC